MKKKKIGRVALCCCGWFVATLPVCRWSVGVIMMLLWVPYGGLCEAFL